MLCVIPSVVGYGPVGRSHSRGCPRRINADNTMHVENLTCMSPLFVWRAMHTYAEPLLQVRLPSAWDIYDKKD